MPASPIALRLGERAFAQVDQHWFAAASGDSNPMHMDPVAARRLLTGHQLVHGIHTLLWALDLWRRDSSAALSTVECEFSNPVNVGDTVVFSRRDEKPGQSTIVAAVEGLACTQVLIDTIEPEAASNDRVAEHIANAVRPDSLDTPLAEPPIAQVGRGYVLRLGDADWLARSFPNAAAALLPKRLAALATLSRFVGMVCPGLNSVFSSVRFAPSADAGKEMFFFVKKYDDRFRLFIISFEGCIRGEIRAFLRPPPQEQPSMQDVAAKVRPGEFGGTRSLVLGGSRGLGETVAKIVAAGQGDVTVSYASGADDAQRVAGEINAFGLGRCTPLKLDLEVDGFHEVGIDASLLDAVYYFATPRIFRKKGDLFDRGLFNEFITFYVDRFSALCAWLETGAQGRQIKVYLPSTVFISDRPKGMTEYAMAKAAAEILVQDLNRSLKNVSVVASRLPRLATDQTASIMKIATDSNVDALLPVVRDLNRRAADA